METTSSALSILPSGKQEVEVFAEKLRTELLNGEIDPLQLTKIKKSFEMVFEAIKDDLRNEAVNVAEKYGKGKFGLHGSEFEVKEMGVRYDYKGCNDPEYKKLSESIKKREMFLKSLTEPFTYIDGGTGEEITINPPVKSSTTSVQVTL